MGVEEVDVGPHEIGIDALVVIDYGQVFAPALGDAPVACMGEALAGFPHQPQIQPGMGLPERLDARGRVVLRIVVHHHALPYGRVGPLSGDGFEGPEQGCAAVVSGHQKR